MISPEEFKALHENDIYRDMLSARDELMIKIKQFETDISQDGKEEYINDLRCLAVISELIADLFYDLNCTPAYVYVKGFNGMSARIPQNRLKEWRLAQEQQAISVIQQASQIKDRTTRYRVALAYEFLGCEHPVFIEGAKRVGMNPEQFQTYLALVKQENK